jgi:hypothetical protein
MTSKCIKGDSINRIWREMLKQPVVTALFVLAVLFVILRTVLLSIPQIFSGGAALGSVIYDLAVAYAAAWFFNLLVVILPRLRDRERVMKGAGRIIERLCLLGIQMPGLLVLNAHQFADLTDPGQVGMFKLRLQSLHLAAESNTDFYDPSEPGRFRRARWHEWIVDEAKRATNLCQSLTSYFPYLESELIQLVNEVTLSKFLDLAADLAKLREPSGDMAHFADPLAEFITACRKLRSYYYAEVIMKDTPAFPEIAGEIVIPA